MTKADSILSETYRTLGLEEANDVEKYSRIDELVASLQSTNARETINAKTTGTISERICETGLRAALPAEAFDRLPNNWQWVGDFSIAGVPYNVVVSVKSFKAKERLLASGSGGILAPTIGWGLFNEPGEWGAERVKAYLFRGFVAIYMPSNLISDLAEDSSDIENINGKRLLRPLENFTTDLGRAWQVEALNIREL